MPSHVTGKSDKKPQGCRSGEADWGTSHTSATRGGSVPFFTFIYFFCQTFQEETHWQGLTVLTHQQNNFLFGFGVVCGSSPLDLWSSVKPREEVRAKESHQICSVPNAEIISLFYSLFTVWCWSAFKCPSCKWVFCTFLLGYWSITVYGRKHCYKLYTKHFNEAVHWACAIQKIIDTKAPVETPTQLLIRDIEVGHKSCAQFPPQFPQFLACQVLLSNLPI